MTRYEKIVAMSVEELTKYLERLTKYCDCQFPANNCPVDSGSCEACWREWLMEEAADG